jgi:hypothetical protein
LRRDDSDRKRRATISTGVLKQGWQTLWRH